MSITFDSRTARHLQVAIQFAESVTGHVMDVRHDDGLYRHLVFKNPQQGSRDWFEITTTPGTLTIRGDWGTFGPFARTDDMFEFFRDGTGPNPMYWAEKLPTEHRSLASEYHEQVAREVIDSIWDEHRDEYTPEQADEIVAEIESAFNSDYSEDFLREELDAIDLHGFSFRDLWECDFTDYTVQFLWCCHAIKWGINQYDAARTPSLA